MERGFLWAVIDGQQGRESVEQTDHYIGVSCLACKVKCRLVGGGTSYCYCTRVEEMLHYWQLAMKGSTEGGRERRRERREGGRRGRGLKWLEKGGEKRKGGR